jgi:hypothetical protein
VALRRASKKLDGTCVWSIIEENDWDLVIQRSGEEIGVFLPDDSASTMSYSQVSTLITLFSSETYLMYHLTMFNRDREA